MSSSTSAEASAGHLLPPAVVALVLPDVGMPRVVSRGGVRGPLVVAMLCALLAGAAGAARVDARAETLQALDASGELKNSSDRQIDEATKSRERAFIVRRVGGAAVAAPVELLLYTGGLFLLSWFLRGRTEGRAMLPVAAAALLPGAVANLLEAMAAFRQVSIPSSSSSLLPRSVGALWLAAGAPLTGPATKILGAFDVFGLWSALLLGFGLAAAARLPPAKAVVAVLVGWGLWRLATQVATGGA